MASGSASSARRGPLDEDERAAIEASQLRSLPPEVIAGLTADASRLHVPAGSMLHREGTTSPHFEIVVTGLVRVYVTAPDDRTVLPAGCPHWRGVAVRVALLAARNDPGGDRRRSAGVACIVGAASRRARRAGGAGSARRAERARAVVHRRDPDRLRDHPPARCPPPPRPCLREPEGLGAGGGDRAAGSGGCRRHGARGRRSSVARTP